MSESWLESGDPGLDAQEIQNRVEARMARRGTDGLSAASDDGERALEQQGADLQGAATLREEAARDRVSRWLQDYDIVPANYVIDWRTPIIGPIHAAIRRVIHAENRRFTLPALIKQSYLNRAMLDVLAELCQENARLCRELEETRQELDRLRADREQGA